MALDWEWGVGQVLWPNLKKWIPWNRVRSVKWFRQMEPEIPDTITLDNGTSIAFKSAASGREKFQGGTLDMIAIDEECRPDIVEECRARLVKRAGLLTVGLTPVRRERWVLDLERIPGSIVIRASMEQAAKAGVLDEAAVSAYLDSLPARQRQVRDRGDFVALEGLVYPEFDPDIHVLHPEGEFLVDSAGRQISSWPLPPGFHRFAAIDFGYSHPCAVPIGALDRQLDRLFIYLCPYQQYLRASVWGSKILPDVLPPLAGTLIADHDRQEREEIRAHGYPSIPAMKDIRQGIEAVERRLVVDGEGNTRLYLVVHESNPPRHDLAGRIDASMAAWEFGVYRYPSPRVGDVAEAKDLPLDRDNHAMDAIRYLVMELDQPRSTGPLPFTPARGYDREQPRSTKEFGSVFDL